MNKSHSSLLSTHAQKKVLYQCSQSDKITSITSSNDETHIFGGNDKGVVHVWQSESGELLKLFDAHAHGAVTCLCVTPDNAHLITGGKDSNVFVWNIAEYVALCIRTGCMITLNTAN